MLTNQHLLLFPSPDISHPEFCPANIPPSPDISHPKFCLGRRSTFSGYLTSGILSDQRSTFFGYLTSGTLSGRRSTFSGYLTSEILSGQRSTFSGCLTSGILPARRSTFSGYLTSGILSWPTFHLLWIFSHPAPDARWERRAIQLPRSEMSWSSNSTYPESIRSWQFKLRRIHFHPQSSTPPNASFSSLHDLIHLKYGFQNLFIH